MGRFGSGAVVVISHKLAPYPSTGKLRGNVCNGLWACYTNRVDKDDV